MDQTGLIPILGIPYNELKIALEKEISQSFRVKQVLDGIYKSKSLTIRTISTLPKEVKEQVEQKYSFFTIREEKREGSKISWTTKFLFRLADGEYIEAVALPNTKKDFTLCLSTQVGCALKCAFCASGHFGLIRNLETHEIVEQALFIKKSGFNVTNIVFMGIGEPLMNYDNVLKAIKIIHDPAAMNIGIRNITISTAGIIEGIRKLSDLDLQIKLSVSLHFPYDDMRSKYMPVNNSNPLPKLVETLKEYQVKTNKIITFEYILIKGLNDNPQIADDLIKLLDGLNYKINIIPYNPVECFDFKTPSEEKSTAFFRYLLKKGIKATLRYLRGDDIKAACGQLRMKELKSS